MENGIFTLDNATYHITLNDHDSRDSLHRGTIGYDQRNWALISRNATTITYMLTDYAFEGYPGCHNLRDVHRNPRAPSLPPVPPRLHPVRLYYPIDGNNTPLLRP
jgi:hypothetical protein